LSSYHAPTATLQHDFRACMAEYPTGISVVTVANHERIAGMTLNSFVSVSLDPLLVLVSLAATSRTAAVIEHGGRFTISFLQRWQVHVAQAFARAGATFAYNYISDVNGHLEVRDALAVIRCRTAGLVPAGDHVLVLGNVLDFERRGGEPLVFHRGRIGGMRPDLETSVGGWEVLDL